MAPKGRDLAPLLDAKTRKQAAAIAGQYSIILRPHERLGFVAHAIEMPLVFADGHTERACLAAIRQALTAGVAVMILENETPPAPISENRRETQVNVRLTAEEKVLLEETAKRRGYRGLSDFVRAAALAKTIVVA
jgi:predicted RNase H-like HicB family nuclease